MTVIVVHDSGTLASTTVSTGDTDSKPRCEYTYHCELTSDNDADAVSVCESDSAFHDDYCLSDPNRPYAAYRLTYGCPECGYHWEELLCEDCVIEGPSHWGYWPGNTIDCPDCKAKDCITLPVISRL